MLRTSLVSLLDQMLWAMTNFGMTALAAHVLGSDSFGALALATTVVVLFSGLCAACAGEPYAVGRGRVLAAKRMLGAEERLAALKAAGNGWVLVLALLTPAIVSTLPALVGARGLGVLLVGIAAPFVVAAEGLRSMAYAQARIPWCVAMSLSWLTVQAVATAVLALLFGMGVGSIVCGWGVGALVATGVGLRVSGARPRFKAEGDDRRRRGTFSFEYLATAGVTHAMALLAAGSVGLAEAGAFRAIQTVFGPLNIVILGIRNALVPTAARHLRGRQLLRVGIRMAAATGLVTCVVVTALALMPVLGRLLMGRQWQSAPWMLFAFGGGRLALAVTVGALLVLRASDETRVSSVLRVVTVAATLVPFVVVLPNGLVPALWASAAGAVLAAVAWWSAAVVCTRSQRVSAPEGRATV